MVFGVILAGGVGSRMGNVEKPKQYLKIGNKPIIIHTIEKFFVHDAFVKLIVLCPKQWMENTKFDQEISGGWCRAGCGSGRRNYQK